MKHIAIIFLLIPMLAVAQDRGAIRDYKRAVKAQREALQSTEQPGAPSVYLSEFEQAAEAGEQLLRQGFEVVIDPIEAVNFTATFSDVAAGSWGEQYLGITRRYKEIYDRLSRKVVVFIFDTGAWNHPALEPVSWHEKDRMYTGEESNEDKHSHSTHCAGIVAGADGDGLDPMAEKGILKVISYKVLSNSGGGLFSWIETGIRDANKEAVKLMSDGWFVVYSFSLGSSSTSSTVDAALQEAKQAGVYIAAAAGNTGREGVNFPGSSEHVHGVGALAQNGTSVQKASYSTTGEQLDISEPGSSILSTVLNGGYAYKSGTSMATPHQARLAAMVASIYPKATANQVAEHLLKYATDLPPAGWDKETGAGWDVVDKLLDNPIGDNPPPPDPEPEKEICNDGKDNDGDGLTDCDDPDCSEYKDCKEEPPTDPPKPVRAFRADFPRMEAMYSIQWKEHTGELETLNFRITIDAKFREDAAEFAERLDAATNKHFRNRWYSLPNGSDYWDAAFWVAYFYDLLMNREEGFDLDVLQIDAFNEAGYPVILTEKDLRKAKGLSGLFFNAREAGTDQN